MTATASLQSIIIEDEPHNREILQRDLVRHCPEVEILETCENPIKGLQAIHQLKPKLVFLDIELPKMNAFEMLECLPDIQFDIIFTTAYDKYVLNALRLSAVDYLMKPISPEELKAAVRRVTQRKNSIAAKEQMSILKDNWQGKKELRKIAIPSVNKIEFVLVKDIIHCSADGGITRLILNNGLKNRAAAKNLGKFEESLTPNNFFRIHHKHLINLNQILEFHPGESMVVMNNGEKLPVSQSKRKEFGEIVKQIMI